MREWLQRIDRQVPLRYAPWLLCGAGALLSGLSWAFYGQGAVALLLFGALSALGLRDRLQARRLVLRNYPVAGHIRYLLEYIRPEIRQYFIEPDHEAAPFSRQQPLTGLPARQGRPRQAALRHAA